MAKRYDRTKALAWLAGKRIKQAEIRRALGQKSASQVSETLQGVRNDRSVLRQLIAMGCPRRYLDLPDDMAEEARK